MAQVTADMLGLPLDDVTAKLGDSSLPLVQVEGGSWTAALGYCQRVRRHPR
jgi:xanthine dehydrogenase YagR molybdenum-binding subunit